MAKHVLVVDDHESWRRNLRTMLDGINGWRIVAEAADGLEAVAASASSAPDLILLDVELPLLNGLEVARRIITDQPDARILFLTGHRSWEVAEAAFDAGARGYVLKMHASHELLPAMNAVAQGRRFVSEPLAGRIAAPSDAVGEDRRHRHDIVFYSQPDLLLDDFAQFAGPALRDGQSVIAVTVSARREELHRRLQARVDVDLAVRQGRYLWMDATVPVDAALRDGRIDETRFWKSATSFFMNSARRSRHDPPRVAVCGEGCGELLRRGGAEAAVRLEQLWDEFTASFHLDLLCGYATSCTADIPAGTLDRICEAHTSVTTR